MARAAALQETSLAAGQAVGVAGFGTILAGTSSVATTAVIAAIIVIVVGWILRFNRGTLTA